jgi:hypothetical protein
MATQISYHILSNERWQKGYDSVCHGSFLIQREILNAIKEGRGSIIGRGGTIELTTVLTLHATNSVDSDKIAILETNAGIFPNDLTVVKSWFEEYTAAMKESNLFAAGWYKPFAQLEWAYLQHVNPNVQPIPLRSLEPYYSIPDMHWTQCLEGKQVTVVSSFVKSMQDQLPKKDRIWQNCPSLLPENIQWSFVRSYYCPKIARGKCGWPVEIESWKDAVNYLEDEVLKTNPTIVLIGCGGLAMPLAWRLKQKGIIAIVLGGAIQLLFGIKGYRWKHHPQISPLFNPDWKFPNHTEIPGNSHTIEGGCYW